MTFIGRHPSTIQLLQWFSYGHLPEGLPRETAHLCCSLADVLVDRLPDGPELTTALRKLLEAKDCAVRAAIDATRTGEPS